MIKSDRTLDSRLQIGPLDESDTMMLVVISNKDDAVVSKHSFGAEDS